MRNQIALCLMMSSLAVFAGCKSDKKSTGAADAGHDAAVADAGSQDSGGGNTADSGSDAAVAATPAPDAERGRYIVENLAACGDCHTPRDQNGPILAKAFSGVDCFLDAIPPAGNGMGCISTRNLTNDDTGLKKYTDQEIKNMFTKGKRPKGDPKGERLHPFMPYWVFGNMSDADADNVVAFLRSLPGVNHKLANQNEVPFTSPAQSTPVLDLATVPTPDKNRPNYAAAMRGRYIAANIGICYECHTTRDSMDRPIPTKAYAGGRDFPRDALGLPPSMFPSHIYSANLTSDTTGLKTWTVAQIVRALKKGIDDQSKPLCPPMPAGPMGAFGGMLATDALDVAYYLKSLPPVVNSVTMCVAGVTDADAGAADAGN
ncbi:MAG TPA: c-type cytochrome [Polyangiales bacterium]